MLPDLCDYFFKVNLKFITKNYVLFSFFAQTYFFFNTEPFLISTRKKKYIWTFCYFGMKLRYIRIENNMYRLCMEFTNIVQRKKIEHWYLLYLWYEDCLNTTLKIICFAHVMILLISLKISIILWTQIYPSFSSLSACPRNFLILV